MAGGTIRISLLADIPAKDTSINQKTALFMCDFCKTTVNTYTGKEWIGYKKYCTAKEIIYTFAT
jgi:hypothetical protein